MGKASRERNLRIRPAQLAFAGALLLALTAPAADAASYQPGFEERTVVGGLTEPTAMAWAPDGRLFVIEKQGRLKVAGPGGTSATTILDISSRVNDFHDRGLLGLAVDSAFASNGYLYLLYTFDVSPLTADSDAPMVSRLERFTVSPDNVIGPPTVLLGSYTEGACPDPSNSVDCIPSDDISHSIGTVRSAPDGTLWVGSGDGASFSMVDPLAFRTYDERSMAGKILHVDREGHGLPGHPFCPSNGNLAEVCSKVWAGGFRNPFRFTLRPGGGLAVGDVGWGAREELDLIPTGAGGGGRLYGWPCYEGNTRTNGYQDRAECRTEYAKEGTPNAHVPPDYDYDRQGTSAAVLGGPTYTGTQYPAGYRDDVFFGDYALGFIRKANIDAQGRIVRVDDFASDWTGVDLEPDLNGDLAYASFGDGSPGSGSIRRIVYSPGNGSPVAVASAAPTSGRSPLDVSLSGSSSTDPDGDPLSYEWDFGDGSPHSSQANPSHRYTTKGAFTAQLTVSDGRGLSDADTVTISVGDPPVASIDSPADGSQYRDGESVQLRGSGTDPDGTLPDSAFHWTIRLHHADHVHPLTRFEGTKTPSFVALDDHDADSYYEVTLRVTDSDGLEGSRTISLRPETVGLTLDSVPPGAPLSYSGIAGVGPMVRTAAVGYRTSISAAERFVAGGREWIFERWSDGGARLHDMTVPAGASTLTAYYSGVGGAVGTPAPGASSPKPPAPGSPRDLTPPKVRITSPGRRGRVSGRIKVRASASDNVGVRAVQFRLDGKKLGKPERWAPFRVRWDTRRVRNGAHRLSAVARDAAGNLARSRLVPVTVRNKRRHADRARR